MALPRADPSYRSIKTVFRTIERLAVEAGIEEVSRRQKHSMKKITPHILRHSMKWVL